MSFEVGKKYQFHGTGNIYLCEFITKNGFAVLSGENSDVYYPLVEHPSSEKWKEYKEPRKLTRYIGIYKNSNNDGISMGMDAYSDPKHIEKKWGSRILIDTVKIEYTEKTE